MLTAFLSRDKKPAARAPAAPSAVAPAPRDTATADLAGVAPPLQDACIKAFGDVPKYLRVVTEGDRPLYKITAQQSALIAALEVTNGHILTLVAEDAGDVGSLVESMRGAFIQADFKVLPVRRASASVIREIYQAAQAGKTPDGARSSNAYLFEVDNLVSYAVAHRATDIHIETHGSRGTVRFRVDGEIESMRAEHKGTYAAAYLENCMYSLYNLAQQKNSGSDSAFDPGENMYCMVPITGPSGSAFKLRFQSLMGNDGPKVVLRLLCINDGAPSLSFEALGYAASQVKLWRQAMDTPSGACFIAGMTNSGKSTTQKSFIELNPNAPHSSIYTIEDPVEYPILHAHQIPLQRNIGNPTESARLYSEAVTALMRADPDIVMLGEIRDASSASAAQQLTETGHMALGTVHAHLLSGIVPRLVNPEIGMHREVLTAPNMLTLLVYQALVPVLCQHCALGTADLSEHMEDAHEVVRHLQSIGVPTDPLRWRDLKGCEHCNQRGTTGQTVVAEMLMPDEDWLRPIREGRDSDAMDVYRSKSDGDLTSQNMNGKTVFEHTLYKALQGQVDARQCSRFDNFARFVKRHRARGSQK